VSNLIGFHSVGLHAYSVEGAIEKVAAAGYDAIELNAETLPWAQPHVTPTLSAGDRRRLRSRVADAGLVVSAVGAHASLVDADAALREANLGYALGCIELAADLGCPVAHLYSGGPPIAVGQEMAFRWLVYGLARCIVRGQRLGVAVAFEPVANHLVHDVAGLQRLMIVLRPLQLYVNLDPSHLHVHGDDVAAAVRAFAGSIAHVHVKDATGTPESFKFPPLGQGDVDFPSFFGALRDVDYSGVLSVEYEADAFGYQETEEQVLGGSLRFVRGLL